MLHPMPFSTEMQELVTPDKEKKGLTDVFVNLPVLLECAFEGG